MVQSVQAQMVEEINREIALIWVHGNLLALWTQVFEDNGLPRFSKNMAGLKSWFSPRCRLVHSEGGKQIMLNPFTAWLQSKQRREFDGIVFRPGRGDVGRKYNLFRGWGVAPAPLGKCELFLAHLRNVICSGDADVYDYVEQWLANIFQKPEDRPGTAITIQGEPGSGKGTIARWLAPIFRSHMVHLAGGDQLLDKFNANIATALLVFGDETVWPGDKAGIEKLKSWITEDVITIEPKYVDKYDINFYGRFLFTTNRDHSAPAELGDRRFVPLTVSKAHVRDKAYFDHLQEELDAGGPAALLHHLQHVKLTRDLRITPRTQTLAEQKLLSLDDVGEFAYDLLMAGRHQLRAGYERESLTQRANLAFAEVTTPATVHTFYLHFCNRNKKGYPKGLAAFGKALRKYIDIGKREARSDERSALAPNARVQIYEMPTLKEGRETFEKALGCQPLDWPEDETPTDDLGTTVSHRASKCR